MNTVILICGWAFIVIVAVILLFIAWDGITDAIEKRRIKRHYKTIKEFGATIFGCHYWLNKDGHKPYRKMFEYVASQIKDYGNVRGDDLRNEVNRIIKEQEASNE